MSNLQPASGAIDSDATGRGGAHRQGRTIMGRMSTRRSGLVALVAALLLGLGILAGVAAGQRRSGEPVASAPAPIAVAAPWTGTCRSDVAGCVPEEQLVAASVPVAPPAPYSGTCRSDVAGCVPEEQLVPGLPAALPAAWTGTCRTGSAGCEPDEALIPGAPVVLPAPYTGPCRSDLAGCVPDEVFIPGVGAVSR